MDPRNLNEAPPEPCAPSERLFETHHALCEAARTLMMQKNHDYASGYSEDPYANFRLGAHLGLCSASQGLLLRVSDKLSRLATFSNTGKLVVTNETYVDAILDIINYLVLLHGMLQEDQR